MPPFADEALDWELIVVDDHSTDATFEAIRKIAGQDARVKGIRLARNSGSHIAKLAGYDLVQGECAIGLASDPQDPPEVFPQLIEKWREGAQIVFAVRTARPGESASTRWFSRAYRFLLGTLMGVEEIAQETGSLMLLDERAIQALRRFSETDPHYLGLIRSMGFRTAEAPFVQAARLHGESKWTLGKKLQLARRTLLAFSAFPIRAMRFAGAALMLAAFAYGWAGSAPAVAAILFVGGVQLVATSWIGEYLWRALQEARARPRYLVEDSVGVDAAPLGIPHPVERASSDRA